MKRNNFLFVCVGFLVLAMDLFSDKVFPSAMTIYGPREFTRSTGKPVVVTETFSAPKAGDGYNLIVLNGKDGKNRVSSAILKMNGAEILKASDFNQQVEKIERSIVLQTANTISVELRSVPRSFITVSIVSEDSNYPPVAQDQTVTTDEDTPKPITLSATDVNGDSLTYVVVTQPGHGTLSGTPPSVTYTPTAHYFGPDSFTFKANDGKLDSNFATVSITVNHVNHAPVAHNQSVTTDEDTANAVILTATDPDGDPLAYEIVVQPTHGTLSGAAPNLTYTPAPQYSGPDSFTFKASDGKLDSNIAAVSITVRHINHPPVAQAQSVMLDEDTTKSVNLAARDPDGDSLTYTVITQPTHGTLSGTAPALTYTPASRYFGPDSFTFKANDGKADSNIATVSITVQHVNHAPVAQAQAVTTGIDTARTISLAAVDADGDALTYAIVAQPSHGTLSGAAPNLTYTPVPQYSGSDSFTFKAYDGKTDSNIATVIITVRFNHPPVARNQCVTTGEGDSKAITLAATDADGDSLTYKVVDHPTHGILSGMPPDVIYTPSSHYFGPDGFTFKANDGSADSNVSWVSIMVTPTVTRSRITTVAGAGMEFYRGDGGPATSAFLRSPSAIAADGSGNIYFVEQGKSRIRKVNANGIITTVAGDGTTGYDGDGGPAVKAKLNRPEAIATDNSGNLYIADTYNRRIRKVDTHGIITTVAGNGFGPTFRPDGGFWVDDDGISATQVTLRWIRGVAVDALGNLYIATDGRIRKVDTNGIITTVADGLWWPGGIAVDAAGNLYVTDVESLKGHIVRKIDKNDTITRVELDDSFYESSSLSVSVDTSGNLYVAGESSSRVIMVSTSGTIIPAAGGGNPPDHLGDGGPATQAQFHWPLGVAADGFGNFYVADTGNGRIRKVSKDGIIATVAGGGVAVDPSGEGGPAISAELERIEALAVDASGNLYISDTWGHRVQKIDSCGIITAVAGNGTEGWNGGGDGGPATQAALLYPEGVAVDGLGNVYIAEGWESDGRIRKVDRNGIITTVARGLYWPKGITLDAWGNLYIADSFNHRVKKLDTSGAVTTLAGSGPVGYGQGAFGGDNGPAISARLNYPSDVALDAFGNLYIADLRNNRIRKVDRNGIMTTVAGNGVDAMGVIYGGDGGPATEAILDHDPRRIAVDGSGNLYIADTGRIRKVDTKGIITTVAGNGFGGYSGDGGPSTAASIQPMGIVFDTSGVLYISTYSEEPNQSQIREVVGLSITGSSIFGKVTDSSTGLPIWNSYLDEGVDSIWSTLTDSLGASYAIFPGIDGSFGVSGLPPGSFSATFVAQGYFPQSINRTLSPGEVQTHDVKLIPFPPFDLVVTSPQYNTGGSILGGGAIVNSSPVPVTGRVTNDAEVTVNGMPVPVTNHEFSMLLPLAEGLNTVTVEAIDQYGQSESATLRVTLITGASIITGMVTDSSTGLPARVATVSVTDSSNRTQSSNTDPHGNFWIPIIPGAFHGTVTKPGYLPHVFSGAITGGETVILNVQLTPPLVLNITSPQDGARVSSSPVTITGTLNRNATVTVNWVPAMVTGNTFIVSIPLSVGSNVIQATAIDQYGQTASQTIHLVLAEGGTVRGTVTELLTGLPVPFATVSITDGSSNTQAVFADNYGGYLIFDVAPGSFNGMVTQLGYVPCSFSGTMVSGGEVIIDVTLALLPPTAPVITEIAAIGRTTHSAIIVWTTDQPSDSLVDYGITTAYGLSVGDSAFTQSHTVLLENLSPGTTYHFRVNSSNEYGFSSSGDMSFATWAPGPIAFGQSVNMRRNTAKAITLTAMDPDGHPLTYQIVDQSIHGTLSGAPPHVVYTPLAQHIGADSFTFKVNNGTLDSNIATVSITVIAPPAIENIITTVVGDGSENYSGDGGPSTQATVNNPWGVAVDTLGNLYIADTNNQRIRKIGTNGIITTVAGGGYGGDGGPAMEADLGFPSRVATDSSGNLYIVDSWNRIRKVDPTGTITTVAGNGMAGYDGDGGPATGAMLDSPADVAVNSNGNLYIADSMNNRIRRVDRNGFITTVAGSVYSGYWGDGGHATAAALYVPRGVGLDPAGNLYIADTSNHCIRKVGLDGIITTIAGTGDWGYSGDEGPATQAMLNFPEGVTVDASGNVYIADSGNSLIRRVDAEGIITTVAGTGDAGYSGDGVPAPQAMLNFPSGVALDTSGNLYIADMDNNRVRKVWGLSAPTSGLIKGKVTDLLTGMALTGVIITIKDSLSATYGGQTGSDGVYMVSGLAAGDFTAAFSLAGYIRQIASGTSVVGQPQILDIQLVPIPSLTVSITSPQDGVTVSSSPITVAGSVSHDANVLVNSVQASVINNTFSVSIPLGVGSNVILVTATDQYGQTASQTIRVVLAPATGGSLAGTVTDSSTGIPIPSATVSVTDSQGVSQSVVTESSGGFTISGIALGAFHGSITKGGYTSRTFSGTMVSGQTLTLNAELTAILPIMTNVAVSGITRNSATVNWTTDQLADSLVEYGTTTSYGSSSTDSLMTTSHTITLGGLTPGTTYHFRVTSKNGYGISSSSTDNSFATKALSPITLVITSPLNNATISRSDTLVKGTVTNATGNETGIVVNGYIGNVYGNEFVVNRVPLADGSNTITSTATDTTGNTETVSVIVNATTMGDYIRITATPESGIAPLQTTVRIESSLDLSGATFSCTGPGTVEYHPPTVNGTKASMTTEGIYYCTASVSNSSGKVYDDTVGITALAKTEMDDLLRAKWDGMKAALYNKDILTGLKYLLDSSMEEYLEDFNTLLDELPNIIPSMQDIEMIYLRGDVAKYRMNRVHDIDGIPVTITYYIYFVKDGNGIWKIQEF